MDETASSEPGIEPNGASNDFRWKAVTFEGDGVHPKRLHRNHQIEIRELNVTMPFLVSKLPSRPTIDFSLRLTSRHKSPARDAKRRSPQATSQSLQSLVLRFEPSHTRLDLPQKSYRRQCYQFSLHR